MDASFLSLTGNFTVQEVMIIQNWSDAPGNISEQTVIVKYKIPSQVTTVTNLVKAIIGTLKVVTI